MTTPLLITSGDCCGASLARSGVSGEVFVWHDILYDGPPREPGWPDQATLMARARFLEQETGGGLSYDHVLEGLTGQYEKLAHVGDYANTVLWFDACLFDQSMLAHILVCLQHQGAENVKLLCVAAFPGIEPYHGLGQLTPQQMASLAGSQQAVTPAQFAYAARVERAFAYRDIGLLQQLACEDQAPLPHVPAAVARWLEEQPDSCTGLGKLASLALAAIQDGCRTPADIFAAVSARDTPPQFWGDSTLWGRINALADHQPPLVRIAGPLPRLPQWEGIAEVNSFRVSPVGT